MNPATGTCALLVILSTCLVESVEAQRQDSFDIIRSMGSITEALGTLSRVVQNLQTKVESQATLLDRLVVTNKEIQVTVSNNLVTKEELQNLSKSLETTAEGQAIFHNKLQASVDLQAATLNNLQTKADGQANLLNNLVNKVDMQATVLDTVVKSEEIQRQAIQLKDLETKGESQETLLRNMSAKAEVRGTLLSSLEAQLKMQPTFLNNLDASIHLQATTLNNMVTKEELQALSRNLETKADGQATLLDTLVNKVDMQAILMDTVLAKDEIQRQAMDSQATTLTNLVTKEELQATLLTNLQSNVTTIGAELENLSEDFHKSVASTGTVEGIIAGTTDGLVVIPLGSGEQWNISSTRTYGVAFDWNARKVYWIDFYANEIRRANLDGSSMEILVTENSGLDGIAVDPVTGNFYYGVGYPKSEIRVCSRSGKNCAVIASGAIVGNYIHEVALCPSEGIIFWFESNNKTIVRADMDGGDARVIISEDLSGVWADEISQRLYWTKFDSHTIGTYDLNGNNRKVLLSGRLSPMDVVVDGDTVYFGNWGGKSVYSLNQNGQLALIANTSGLVRYITLFGRNKVPSRRNPCHRSACPNVCVLNRESYTCL